MSWYSLGASLSLLLSHQSVISGPVLKNSSRAHYKKSRESGYTTCKELGFFLLSFSIFLHNPLIRSEKEEHLYCYKDLCCLGQNRINKHIERIFEIPMNVFLLFPNAPTLKNFRMASSRKKGFFFLWDVFFCSQV